MSEVPIDVGVERAVLGCVLLKPELFRRLQVPQDAFAQEFHRTLYSAMNDLDADGMPPDLVLTNGRLREQGIHRDADLSAMLDDGALTRHFDYYVERLKQVALRREMVRLEGECAALASAPGSQPDEIDRFRAERLRRAREIYWPVERGMEPVEGWCRLQDFYQRSGELAIGTGFPSLDEIMGEIHPQSVVTVLARPGVGKSVLGLNLTANWLRRAGDWGVLFASLEMGDTLATDRLIRILDGWTKEEVRDAVRSGAAPEEYLRLTKDRFCLFHRARQPLSAIERALEAWERSYDRKIRAVVIDYFQYLAGDPRESPYVKASRLSREMKEFAKVNDCLVINLCQVSRGEPGGKTTKCPTLEAARDSGTIEENADVVLGMWKPSAEDTAIFLKALKVRQGLVGGQCELQFSPSHMRLCDTRVGRS